MKLSKFLAAATSGVFAWAMAATTAAAASGLVAQTLPTGTPQLFEITCPTAAVCYAAGGDQTTAAVIVSTTDSGTSWHAQRIAGSLAFAEIACADTTDCVAVGYGSTQQAGGVFATHDGRTWMAGVVPASTGLLQAVTCPTRDDCLAAGGSLSATTFVTSTDGGTTWSAGSIPLTAGVTDLDCVDASHCWAAGLGGLYFTSDLGVTWQPRGPTRDQLLPADCLVPIPPGSFGAPDCVSFYDGVDFTDASHGWLVAEGKGLGRGPSVGTSRVFRTSDGGASWQLWTPPASFPLKSALPSREMAGLACRGGACSGVAQVVDGSTGQATSSEIVVTSDGRSWVTVAAPSTILTNVACPTATTCFASGYAGSTGVILGGLRVGAGPAGTTSPGAQPLATGNSDRSTLATSLVTPQAAFSSLPSMGVNALLVLALVLLVVFPSQLFNHTFEENHEEIRAAWERRFPWTGGARRAADRSSVTGRGAIGFAVVVVVGSVLASLLDPHAGANTHTLALVLGVAAAILFGVGLGGTVGAVYRGARHEPVRWGLRALPSGLVVAAACVLISRLTSFTPGYLYGIIGGVAFAGELGRHQTGHLVAISSVTTLAVSVIAWLVWVPVHTAASNAGAGFGSALLENVLAAIFVGGLVGTVVGLVPLRFLPGEKLAAWHWGAWLAVFAVAAFGLLQIMLRPQSSGAHVNSVAFWTTAGLFMAFGAASVTFWAYFRMRRRR